MGQMVRGGRSWSPQMNWGANAEWSGKTVLAVRDGCVTLGNALTMLGLRYDAAEGRDMAARIARCMRDAAYAASVDLAGTPGGSPRTAIVGMRRARSALLTSAT